MEITTIAAASRCQNDMPPQIIDFYKNSFEVMKKICFKTFLESFGWVADSIEGKD